MKKYKQKSESTIKSCFLFWEVEPIPPQYRYYYSYWIYIVWFPIIAIKKDAIMGDFFVVKDNIGELCKHIKSGKIKITR